MNDPVGVIEAAYAVDLTLEGWLQGLVDAAAPSLDRGLGVWAGLYDASQAPGFSMAPLVGVNVSRERLDTLSTAATFVPYAHIEACFVQQQVGTLSELLPGFLDENPLAEVAREQHGVHDMLGLNAQDPTLRGCVFGVMLPKRQKATKAFGERWKRVCAHVSAGLRLRRQLLAPTMVEGEAVLDPGGELQHAEGPAKEPAARMALRSAAVALDKARTRRAREGDPDGCVEAWKALVAGRWSLVDHFEKDGRRYYVARKNDPLVDAGTLSQRERQVLGYAALGHSNKLIAYELGLSVSTVATHLVHAAKKLGVRSRVELIRKFRGGETAGL